MKEKILSEQQLLQHHFINWQCRIRQFAVRKHDGRPSEGMRPVVYIDGEKTSRLTVLINKKELGEIVKEFQHMYRKTLDPAQRCDAVLKLLMAGYFQHAEEFSDKLTALISCESMLTQGILEGKQITLKFDYQSQKYSITCSVHELAVDDLAFQATYWHNALFNPGIPFNIKILAFKPDWKTALASPSPTSDHYTQYR